MDRPNCGLLNPPAAERCDCGFDFASRSVKDSLLSAVELKRASEDPNRVFWFGSVGLLSSLLIKWVHGAITGEARTRRRLKAALKRSEQGGADK